MKTSSPYPVLDNRPIDQWKVTELKEELKRRKLTTKGLKDDLIKRLDEAIRIEREDAEQVDNGIDDPEAEIADEASKTAVAGAETGEAGKVVPVNAEETMGNDDGKDSKMDDVSVQGDIKASAEQSIQNKSLEEKELELVNDQPPQVEILPASQDKSLEEKESELVNDQPPEVGILSATEEPPELEILPVSQAKSLEEKESELVNDQPPKVEILSATEEPPEVEILPASQDKSLEEKEAQLVNDQPPKVEVLSATEVPSAGVGDKVCEGLSSETVTSEPGFEDDKMERDNDDSRAQQGSEDIKPSDVDVKLDTSDPNNQVSEVSTNLGFPIKSNYISTDSVSINEKNELEDNIIADNVKLEPDVKPEMVQPSSSDLVPDGGESHPKDVEEPQNKVSVEETYNNVTNTDMSQKNHSADLGSSEKLNLDRSSGDDSMEEDALESKQIDSNYNSEEVGERTKKFEVTNMKEEGSFAAMDTDLPAEEKSIPENKDVAAASSDKRKLPEQGTVLSHEPSKRQRRWKSESNKVGDPHISNTPPAATKDVAEPAVLKRNFSRSDSVGANDTAKEREVPPSAKAATNSLRIDRFLRPFTLKAVQELLAKTGTVTSFWMDHIKTHCYVTYSSVEEAVDTRNVVYNLQWPPNGGRHLVAEFVDPEEVKSRVEVPPPQPPVAPAAPEPPPTLPQPSPRQQNLKQQMSQQPTLPPPPPLSNPAPAREFTHLPPPPPPPPQEKVEAPIVTLDDLFRKTKTTPRIYYLPLSEEQVSAVLEERRKNSRQ